jgi:hypothetical protein
MDADVREPGRLGVGPGAVHRVSRRAYWVFRGKVDLRAAIDAPEAKSTAAGQRLLRFALLWLSGVDTVGIAVVDSPKMTAIHHRCH